MQNNEDIQVHGENVKQTKNKNKQIQIGNIDK